MRKNRFPVIDGDGHITERSKEILEYLGGNYRGTSQGRKLGRYLFAFSFPRWLVSTLGHELAGLARLSRLRYLVFLSR